MALKPILNFNPDEYEVVPEYEYRDPYQSRLKEAGEFGLGLATRAAQAPFKLAELPVQGASYLADYLKSKGIDIPPAPQDLGLPQEVQKLWEPFLNPKAKQISERIEEWAGPKRIKPTNMFSKALQYTAGNWPLLLLGSGGVGAKLGADIAGSLGMTGAEKLGFGPLAQVGAGVLGSAGFGRIASSFKQPSKITEYTSRLYDTEKKLGSTINVDPNPIRGSLEKLYGDAEKQFVTQHGFTEAAQSRVLKNIRNAEGLIIKPKVTGSDIFEVKKLLNQTYASKESLENVFYKRLRSIFHKELDKLSKSNNKWGVAWKKADELYKIEHWQSGLGKILSDQSNKGTINKVLSNPVAQGATTILAGFAGHPKTALLSAAPLLVQGSDALVRSYKFLNSLGRTKEGQKVLWEVVAHSAKQSPNKLFSSLNKLNKESLKFYPEKSTLRPIHNINFDDYEKVA